MPISICVAISISRWFVLIIHSAIISVITESALGTNAIGRCVGGEVLTCAGAEWGAEGGERDRGGHAGTGGGAGVAGLVGVRV